MLVASLSLAVSCLEDIQTYRHPFSGFFSWTTWVSPYQKDITIMDCNEARDVGVAVALSGAYTDYLHLAPDRQPHQFLITRFS